MNAIQESIATVDRLLSAGTPDAHDEAVRLLEQTLAEQVTDENHISYGQFPKEFGGPTGDINMALFLLPRLFDLRENHAAILPSRTTEALEQGFRRAIEATQRRWDEELFDLKRDHKAYSNIFLLYIQAFVLAGRFLDNERLARVGTAQWKRWFCHVAYFGIDEFVSDYYKVDFEALTRIRALTPDANVREQATRVLDHLSVLAHAVTHPMLELPVCGSARSYRRFLAPPGENPLSLADLTADTRNDTADAYHPPNSVVTDYRTRTFPYSISGRAGTTPFRFQSWQDRRAALGSMTGGNYFWQQIHCMAAVGNDPDRREVLFMPGSYCIANGYVCQRDNRALCLFSRRANTYLRTQKFVPDADMPDEFGDFGIGVSSGWEMTATPERMIFTAYGHRVVVEPFAIEDATPNPVLLAKTQRNSLSQGRFHRTPVEMTEYVFPEPREWFGCQVSLIPVEAALPPPSVLEFTRDDHRLSLRESSGLSLALHLNPAGGDVELYDDDWRTLPLLENDRYSLRPGELITNFHKNLLG